jgi:hypothetical protein
MTTEAYNPQNAILQSERDGWLLGYVGIPWPGPWPKRNGDLFVTDPAGWQAGIAWESSGPDIKQIQGPTADRWGVFQVKFPIAVNSEEDLIQNFHLVLPLLKGQRAVVGPRGKFTPNPAFQRTASGGR